MLPPRRPPLTRATPVHLCRFLKFQDVFSLFDALVQDEELLVRQHVAEQLSGVAAVCVNDGGKEGYQALIEVILPGLARLLSDGQAEVGGGTV